jgi:hypothetical protein
MVSPLDANTGIVKKPFDPNAPPDFANMSEQDKADFWGAKGATGLQLTPTAQQQPAEPSPSSAPRPTMPDSASTQPVGPSSPPQPTAIPAVGTGAPTAPPPGAPPATPYAAPAVAPPSLVGVPQANGMVTSATNIPINLAPAPVDPYPNAAADAEAKARAIADQEKLKLINANVAQSQQPGEQEARQRQAEIESAMSTPNAIPPSQADQEWLAKRNKEYSSTYGAVNPADSTFYGGTGARLDNTGQPILGADGKPQIDVTEPDALARNPGVVMNPDGPLVEGTGLGGDVSRPITPGNGSDTGGRMLPPDWSSATPNNPRPPAVPIPPGIPAVGNGAPTGATTFGPGNDLRSTQINPTPSDRLNSLDTLQADAANAVGKGKSRGDIAQGYLDAFDLSAAPKLRDQLRTVGQRAASLGRIGMGDTAVEALTPYTDYLTQRDAYSKQLASDSAAGDIGDRLNNLGALNSTQGQTYGQEAGARNETRGERDYQTQTARTAIQDAINQWLMEQQQQNTEFDQGMRLSGLGYGNSPSNLYFGAGQQYGNAAGGDLNALMGLFQQYMSGRKPTTTS